MGKGRRGPQGQGPGSTDTCIGFILLNSTGRSFALLEAGQKAQQPPLISDFQEAHEEGDSLGKQPETPLALCNPNFCPHATVACSPIWFSTRMCPEGMLWCLFCFVCWLERKEYFFPFRNKMMAYVIQTCASSLESSCLPFPFLHASLLH